MDPKNLVPVTRICQLARSVTLANLLKPLGAYKGGVRIGKTPKKLASICCP
jgi:hypothetical protein